MPPESYNETFRLKVSNYLHLELFFFIMFPNRELQDVKKYLDCKQWDRSQEFHKLMNRALHLCSVSGVSISLIDETRQVVKYCHSLSVRECPRRISIDGHAILSSQYFIILDASKDWRFANNPLVKGFPKIRLYAGVPIITSNKQVIGVFAIFDGFSRYEFDSSYIQELQRIAKEVMNLLESPVKEGEINKLRSDTNLINKIGRATSNQIPKLLTVPVYERDGSGSPYSQNHNFRFSKHELTEQDSINHELWQKLFNTGNFKSAAKELTKLISERLDLDLVYIMEIRVAEVYKINPEFFPKGNEIEAEDFKFANKLQRLEKEHIITRVIGSFPDIVADRLDEQGLHYRALSSEFGIFIKSKTSSARYKNGICMSFYRIPSKLVRKKKVTKNEKSFGQIDLYLKSGGYIIGAFSETDKEITHDQINYIVNGANIYRKMYISDLV